MIDKIISWNVRGVNDVKKKNIIRGCLSRWKPDLVCLQESKLDSINDYLVKSLWNYKENGWLSLPANNIAGGILIMWKKDILTCIDHIPRSCSLSCHFSNINNNERWFFTGVYCRGANDRHLMGRTFSLSCALGFDWCDWW